MICADPFYDINDVSSILEESDKRLSLATNVSKGISPPQHCNRFSCFLCSPKPQKNHHKSAKIPGETKNYSCCHQPPSGRSPRREREMGGTSRNNAITAASHLAAGRRRRRNPSLPLIDSAPGQPFLICFPRWFEKAKKRGEGAPFIVKTTTDIRVFLPGALPKSPGIVRATSTVD